MSQITNAKAAIALGQVSVGVASSRIARRAATRKMTAPPSASLGPISAPPRRQADPKAASPMAVVRRSAGAATVAKA